MYLTASIQLHNFLSQDYTLLQIDSFQSKFLYETYPKILFLNDTSIKRQIDSFYLELNSLILFTKTDSIFTEIYNRFYQTMGFINNRQKLDSLANFMRNTMSYFSSMGFAYANKIKSTDMDRYHSMEFTAGDISTYIWNLKSIFNPETTKLSFDSLLTRLNTTNSSISISASDKRRYLNTLLTELDAIFIRKNEEYNE